MRLIKPLFMRIPLLILTAAAMGPAPKAEAQTPTPMSFFPVTPCRLWDTRVAGGPLVANNERSFPVRGLCGVPISAQAVAINLTVTGQTDLGNLRAFPAGTAAPNASVLNFSVASGAIANGAIIQLGNLNGNHITIKVDMPVGSTGTVHNLADVTGYFQP